MIATALAALHGSAFDVAPRPWQAATFQAFADDPAVTILTRPDIGTDPLEALAVYRIVADETELLTLAVAPEARRKGLASSLIANWLDDARGAGVPGCVSGGGRNQCRGPGALRGSGFCRGGFAAGLLPHAAWPVDLGIGAQACASLSGIARKTGAIGAVTSRFAAK